MTLIIQKFGGTSLASPELIAKAAEKAVAERKLGNDVVVVVSARAGMTNELVKQARAITCSSQHLNFVHEHDVVISAGEQISAGLMAIAISKLDVPAQSFLGWQLPILTDDNHSSANIYKIDPEKLQSTIRQGIIPVVAGFQGISRTGRITTLGRGGSDLTAVALADALQAERCDIYTDVDGVYTSDPKMVENAKLLKNIMFEEMYVLAQHGAKVLQPQSVESAWHRHVNLRVLSSFKSENNAGTILCRNRKPCNPLQIQGIAMLNNRAKITLSGVKQPLRTLTTIGVALDKARIKVEGNIQTLVQNRGSDQMMEISFIVAQVQQATACNVINKNKNLFSKMQTQDGKAAITMVGNALRHTSMHKKIANVLVNRNICFETIAAFGIVFTVLVDNCSAAAAVKCLHRAFDLNK